MHMGLVIQHPDGADFGLGNAAGGAQHWQQPARLGVLAATNRQRQPHRGAEIGMHALWPFGGVAQFFRGRATLAPQPHEGGGYLVGVVGREDSRHQRRFILDDRIEKGGQRQHPFVVTRGDFVGRGCLGPGGVDGGGGQQTLGLLAVGRGDDDGRHALVAGAPGPTGPMQQGFAVARQIGMDHQFQPRKVKAAGCHIGRDADPRAAIAHRLQGMRALVLRQFARKRYHGKAAIVEPGHQMVDGSAGRAEYQRILGLVEPQYIDDGILAVGRGHLECAIFDIDMLAAFTGGSDPDSIALVALRQRGNGFGDGGREHQGPPVLGSRLQDEFEVFPKAQIQHLVGLVQHGSAQTGHIQRAALDMVAQATRRANHNMGPVIESALFCPEIHAADARGDVGPGFGIEPLQFALHLHRQLARWGDDQGQRRRNIGEAGGIAQKRWGQSNPKGNGLARAGLRRDQRIGIGQFGREHGDLNRRQFRVAALFQCQAKRRNNAFELCHLGLSIVRVGCLHEVAAPLPEAGHDGVAHTGESRPCIGRRWRAVWRVLGPAHWRDCRLGLLPPRHPAGLWSCGLPWRS